MPRSLARFVAPAGALVAMLIIGRAALLGRRSIDEMEASQAWVEHTQTVLQKLDRLIAAIDNAEANQRAYVITGDKLYIAPHDRAITRVRATTRSLHPLMADNPIQVRSLDTLERLVNAKVAFSREVVRRRMAYGFDSAAALVGRGRGRILMDSIHSLASVMTGRERSLLNSRLSVEQASLTRAEAHIEIGIVIAAILAIVSVLLTDRTIAALAAGRRTSAHIRALLDSTGDGIYGLDGEGRITFANKSMADSLGYALDELVGRHGHSLLHHTRPDGTPYPAEDCAVYRAASSGVDGKIDNEIIWRRDGTSIPVEYSINRVKDTEASESTMVISVRDITERQWAEAALRTAKEAAEGANQAKSDFLARMSHELRTPLNSVIGFANVLIRNKGNNLREQDVDYAGRIQKNGVHLLTLINDILDLSKIEAGRMELEIAPVALSELVGDVASQFEPQLAGRPVRLETRIPGDAKTLETDPGKLRQVLTNLVANAIKFTESGTVTVTVGTDESSHVPKVILVTDSGIGIPQSRLSAIFEEFEQADRSTTRRFGGTGLGLPIARSLCELMGYTLTVESTEGKGSTFTIDLAPTLSPITSRRDDIVLPQTHDAELSALLSGKVVLVIDDDDDSRLLIAHQVNALGARAVSARSGTEGLKLARRLRPDLITLDLLMPNMNGKEVLKRLEADLELRRIPVVIVTALRDGDTEGIKKALPLVSKPLDRANLAYALKRGFGLGRVLIVEDDADTQQLLAGYVFEAGAAQVRLAATNQEAVIALDEFQPDLVLLDLILPRQDGDAFLAALANRSESGRPSVIVVTSKELLKSEERELALATFGVLRKGANLESELRQLLLSFRDRRSTGKHKVFATPDA